MKFKLKLTRGGKTMAEGTIDTHWCANGLVISTGEILCDVGDVNLTHEVEAPGDGKLIEILVAEGKDATIGQDVCAVLKND